MSSLLKDIYSPAFVERFSGIVKEMVPGFDQRKFARAVFTKDWETKELKARMRHLSVVLKQFMSDDFRKTTTIIEKIITRLRQTGFTGSSVEFMFFPDYIELYGIDHFDASVRSIEFVTQFISCEFAVRPFIIRYGDRMLEQMHEWASHKDHRVRRLASEGSRPRLPWAIALPALKKDPSPILPLLEKLKNDPSDFVRRSVANSLNDIAKDNPDILLAIAANWKGISKETDALIKHGCRTLLKQGHPAILKYYGWGNNPKLTVSGFTIKIPNVKIGGHLEFSFTIANKQRKEQTVRLEYAIFYLRKNGQHTKKVFKISERQFRPGETAIIHRKQSFRIITTKTFYPGLHKLSLIVNGQEQGIAEFKLTR